MSTGSVKLVLLVVGLLIVLIVPVAATTSQYIVTLNGSPTNSMTGMDAPAFYDPTVSGSPLLFTVERAGLEISNFAYWHSTSNHWARVNLSYNNHNYSTVKIVATDVGYNNHYNGSGSWVGWEVRLDYIFDYVDPTITSLPGLTQFVVYNPAWESEGNLYDNLTNYNPAIYGTTYNFARPKYSDLNNTANISTIGFAIARAEPYGSIYTEDKTYTFTYGAGATPASSNSSLSGYTNDAYTNTTLAAVSVASVQGTSLTTNTSTAAGAYRIAGMIDDIEALITASKSGYSPESFSFTPTSNTSYTTNISLMPSYVPNSTAIIGIVYRSWDGAPVPGATVTLANSSWSGTYTSTMTGFYIFDGLPASAAYTVSATATGYSTSSSYSVTTSSGVTVQQDIPLYAQYDVTVTAKDGSTGLIIQSTPVYFEVSDGQTANTTTGTHTFTVNSGTHTFTSTASGYSMGQQQASVTADTSLTLLMYNMTTPDAAAIRYIPHTVRLVFVNQLGIPIPSAHVTAITSESSTPSNWLMELFGIPSSVGMNTTTLAGSTDSAGSISFAMADVLKYDILVYNSTAGFSKNFTLYPKEDQYTFQINLAPTVANLFDVVKWNLSSYDFSSTQISMNLTYNDSAMQTTSLIFYVNGTLNLTPIYTKTVTLTNGNGSAGYVVTNTKGDSLSWGFIAENSAFGTITDMMGLTMKGIAGRLIETGWTTELYLWASYLILFVVAALFSYANIRFGAVILPFIAGGLWWIGWLSISWVLLGSLMALGVLVYINRSEVKTR